MTSPKDKLLNDVFDRIFMLEMGNKGNTAAHLFLEDVARSPLRNAEDVLYRWKNGDRLFVPPKDKDRVLMFDDHSGVYIHSDGFCTPMGADISHEVGQWQEITPH